jgi:hypothetical protein
MNDPDTGEEVFSVSFDVKSASDETRTRQAGWLVGTWKTVHRQNKEVRLVVEFRQEQEGIFGYIVQLNDENLISAGFTNGEAVYRNYSIIDHPTFKNYADGECRRLAYDPQLKKDVKSGWGKADIRYNWLGFQTRSTSTCVHGAIADRALSETKKPE